MKVKHEQRNRIIYATEMSNKLNRSITSDMDKLNEVQLSLSIMNKFMNEPLESVKKLEHNVFVSVQDCLKLKQQVKVKVNDKLRSISCTFITSENDSETLRYKGIINNNDFDDMCNQNTNNLNNVIHKPADEIDNVVKYTRPTSASINVLKKHNSFRIERMKRKEILGDQGKTKNSDVGVTVDHKCSNFKESRIDVVESAVEIKSIRIDSLFSDQSKQVMVKSRRSNCSDSGSLNHEFKSKISSSPIENLALRQNDWLYKREAKVAALREVLNESKLLCIKDQPDLNTSKGSWNRAKAEHDKTVNQSIERELMKEVKYFTLFLHFCYILLFS